MEKLSTIWQKRLKTYEESYTLQFTRYWSFPFTYLLYHTPISANLVSTFSFILKVIGLIFITLNGFGFRPAGTDSFLYIVLSAVFLWAGMVFDCVDGELSRVKGTQSKYGEWLDGSYDRISDVLLLIAVSINALNHVKSAAQLIGMNHTVLFVLTLVVSYFAVTGTSLWRLINEYTKISFKIPPAKNPVKKIGFDQPAMYLLLVVLIFLNQLIIFVWIMGLMMTFAWIRAFLRFAVKYRNKV